MGGVISKFFSKSFQLFFVVDDGSYFLNENKIWAGWFYGENSMLVKYFTGRIYREKTREKSTCLRWWWTDLPASDVDSH
jgi:hypothetical protein